MLSFHHAALATSFAYRSLNIASQVENHRLNARYRDQNSEKCAGRIERIMVNVEALTEGLLFTATKVLL